MVRRTFPYFKATDLYLQILLREEEDYKLFLRIFSKDIKQEDLDWHQDANTRVLYFFNPSKNCVGWGFQRDNELIIDLEGSKNRWRKNIESSRVKKMIQVPESTYHRLIKFDDRVKKDLVVLIYEFKEPTSKF